jgi:hypothetical protein
MNMVWPRRVIASVRWPPAVVPTRYLLVQGRDVVGR